MKTSLKRVSWFLCLTSGIIFSSCVQEDLTSSFDLSSSGQPVTINLDAASVLTTDEGDAADRVVSSFRALIYYAANGELAFNIPVDVPTPSRIDIRTGTYDFVFIANENSDPALKVHLTSANNADIDHINKLRALSFARSAFAPNEDIPMVKFIPHVDVLGDNKIRIAQLTDIQTGTWTVAMQRVATRLKLSVTMTPDQYAEWATSPKITLINIPSKAFVLPEMDNSDYQNATGEDFAASATAAAAPGFISAADADGNVTVTYDRLILPELFLAPSNNIEANVIKLSMTFGDKVKTGMMKAPDGDAFGYSLPRNTFLKMDATVKVDKIDIQAEVLPWGDADMDVPFDGQYTLTVDQSDYYFNSYGRLQLINATTDYPTGWTAEAGTATWAILPTKDNNQVGAAAYTGTSVRTGTLVVRAGNLKKTIRVTQFPPVNRITDKVLNNSYVGAFWKGDQQGERLINIPSGISGGKWTAIVAEGEDWIHLDTLMTSDPNVGWLEGADETLVKNGNDAGFESTYFVTGNYKYAAGTVSGTKPGIYFRIGLNSMFASTESTPARYGVIILAYGNNMAMQRIWIRQGEEPDYLMRNGDPLASGSAITTRTKTVKLAAYNLTAAHLNEQVSINGATDDPGLQPAIFTDYPSQGGAHFEWMNPEGYERYAWDGYTPKISDGNWMDYIATPWGGPAGKGLGNVNESCPEGYRRPMDGPVDYVVSMTTAAEVNLSEVRQSMFAMLPLHTDPYGYAKDNTTSVYGYYADGYFDRRQIVDSPTGTTLSTVANNTPAIAYEGNVFFNINNNASLFLPASGYRIRGDLANVGYIGFFWTSSIGTNNVWQLSGGSGTRQMGKSSTGQAESIRCVIESTPALPAPSTVVDTPNPPLISTYVGAFWKHDQTGERLINIPRPTSGAADGEWSAQVLVGADWIKLDQLSSTDPNIGWLSGADESKVENGNDAGFDANHPVSDNRRWVYGLMNDLCPQIYFRIGLKGTIAAGEHRYGVVLLKYKDNSVTQRIWIRQGEEPDYLFKNSDPVSTGGLTARTVTAQFSPYNLTAATLNAQVSVNGATGSGLQPAIFTAYPSQAGAYWQWASNDLPRYAWSPVGNVTIPTLTNTNVSKTDWDTNKATNESCPAGYRRIKDGPTSGLENNLAADITQSEILQSLWLNPQPIVVSNIDNIRFGYYADGFFDRRQLGTPTGVTDTYGVNSAVAVNTVDVAYKGVLFYHPTSHASWFIPFAGSRSSAGLNTPGYGLNSWTSGTIAGYSGDHASEIWGVQKTGSTAMSLNHTSKQLGGTIRCVLDK